MYKLVAAILALSMSVGLFSQADPYFERAIRRFEISDMEKPPEKGGILFIGSSSIVGWRSLAQDYPDKNVINRGFGGSQIIDSIRNAHRIVIPYQPKMIVFFAGTNDIASGRSAETVFAHYKAFVGKVHAELPDTKIAFISITPAPSRWSMLNSFMRANEMIKHYSENNPNLMYIDAFDEFLNTEGGPRPELFVDDRLHMNPKGYEIWKRVVGPYLP